MPTPEEITVVQTPAVSTKRQVTAAVATTAVTVVLGVGAQYLISKVATRVHQTIIPVNTTEME